MERHPNSLKFVCKDTKKCFLKATRNPKLGSKRQGQPSKGNYICISVMKYCNLKYKCIFRIKTNKNINAGVVWNSLFGRSRENALHLFWGHAHLSDSVNQVVGSGRNPVTPQTAKTKGLKRIKRWSSSDTLPVSAQSKYLEIHIDLRLFRAKNKTEQHRWSNALNSLRESYDPVPKCFKYKNMHPTFTQPAARMWLNSAHFHRSLRTELALHPNVCGFIFRSLDFYITVPVLLFFFFRSGHLLGRAEKLTDAGSFLIEL